MGIKGLINCLQLNHIKDMASSYPCYDILRQKKVKFLPSFMIQGKTFYLKVFVLAKLL